MARGAFNHIYLEFTTKDKIKQNIGGLIKRERNQRGSNLLMLGLVIQIGKICEQISKV